ncbi:GSU2403 family nucleotidyltransferase fold protein [Aquamicrobium terrae]|uniref:Nucleotidyltransferase-like domain-containing protein n=1 Tax=Aquamicrobium terrae TaxID=1324945 RepID=A0ABV2N886_9HYPH
MVEAEEEVLVQMIESDPRVFAAHKLWVSKRADREPVKRRRDLAQAKVMAQFTASHFDHLPYEANAVRSPPKAVFEDAKHGREQGPSTLPDGGQIIISVLNPEELKNGSTLWSYELERRVIRTPGPPPFPGMNSMPALSKAVSIFAAVSRRPPRTPSSASRRAIVGSETPEWLARSPCDHPKSARAALTWRIVISLFDSFSIDIAH